MAAGLRKIVILAKAFHLSLEVRHGDNTLSNAANLPVILGIANTKDFEVLLPNST